MKNRRSGAALPLALSLFLLCATLSAAVVGSAFAAATRRKAVLDYERQYASASSAARLIRDSLTDPDDASILTRVIQQYVNGRGGETLTVTLTLDGLPPAVCRVRFDDTLNLTVQIETERLALSLAMIASTPGKLGWNVKDARIARAEKEAVP